MLNLQSKRWLKIWLTIAAATLFPSQSNAPEPEHSTRLFCAINSQTIDFASGEFEKAVRESSKDLVTQSFGSIAPQPQTVLLEELEEDAQRRLADLKNCFLTFGKNAVQGASEPLSKQACQDLRMLSSNAGSGLKAIFQALFGRHGISPLKTDAGRVLAMCALTNPVCDLQLLNARRAKIEFLTQNPDLLEKLEKKLKAFARTQELSYNLILNPKQEPEAEEKKHWFWQKGYWTKKPSKKTLSAKDFEEFNDGVCDGTVKPALASLIELLLTIPFYMTLEWTYNHSRSDHQHINQYRKIGLPAMLGIGWVYTAANGIKYDTKFFKKLDSKLPINKSKMINFNLLFQPVFDAEHPSNNIEYQVRHSLRNLVRYFILKSIFTIFPQATVSSLRFLLEKAIRPIFWKIAPATTASLIASENLDEWVKHGFDKEMESDFIPSAPELWRSKSKTNLALLAVLIYFYVKPFYKSIAKIQAKRQALKDTRAQLCHLRSMLLLARDSERLFYGVNPEFDQLTSGSGAKDSFGTSCWPMLNSQTFTDPKNDSSFFNYGAVIAVYKFLTQGLCTENKMLVINKDDAPILALSPLLEKIGEIDLCTSLARLLLSSQDSPSKFCLTEFADQKEACFVGSGVWHPICRQEQAVANDAFLGRFDEAQEKPCHGQVVTGGNSTGKSVYTSSLAIAAYLGQCLGVSPATELKITPFERFMTQINTQDDPTSGKSLFRIQIKQVGQLAAEIVKMGQLGQKALICMDESLSGTPAQYATALLGSVMKHVLAKEENFILLFATHLKALATNADTITNGKLLPAHIVCNTDQHGLFDSSTFKVKPGTSSLDSALIVAKEEWGDLLDAEQTKLMLDQAISSLA